MSRMNERIQCSKVGHSKATASVTQKLNQLSMNRMCFAGHRLCGAGGVEGASKLNDMKRTNSNNKTSCGCWTTHTKYSSPFSHSSLHTAHRLTTSRLIYKIFISVSSISRNEIELVCGGWRTRANLISNTRNQSLCRCMRSILR